MDNQNGNSKPFDSSQDPLKEFEIAQLSVSEKSSPVFGKKIAGKIWGYTVSGLGGYFYNRNLRFQKNRNFAHGLIDVQAMFQDRFQMNGKQNYIRLVWNTLQIVNRIVSGLVGRWMQRGEKIQVQAIDDLSQKDKKEEYEQVEFIISNRKQLEELQAQSGVQMIPQDKEIPADQDELNLWQAQFQRIPEEIMQEMGCNDVLESNGWFGVMKEKSLHDSAEVGLVGTNTWMDEQGIIHVDWVRPEDAIYSATDYPDMRDNSWRGEIPSMKISELRRCYGKEFFPNDPLALSEQEIFAIAQTAKEYKTATNITWDIAYNTVYLRPYDEWNVRSMKFQLKTVDSEPYTITTSKSTGTTYTQKGMPVTSTGKLREKPSDNQKIISDTNVNIYEGVYLPDNDILLKWGLKKNMIRPQDPKEIGNAEFSYSFYMYQNYQMRNLAVPEKIEAAIDNMMLACLKIQQDMARSIPSGWVIDETALQAIDYGLGDSGNKAVDPAKHFFQTGLLYYKGLDAEGNRIPVPIQEIANSGFAAQMDAFIRTYQFWYQTLKDELGEDPNLISAALQPRVTAENVGTSQTMAEYATDYMYKAYAEVMQQTAGKISCLLKDSITYGSKAYRDIVNAQDIGDRVFSTVIKLTPTEQEMAIFEATMQKALDNTPELALFITPFQLSRIAKEDVKLAEMMFRNGQKKMLIWKQQTTAQNTQATIDGQIKSAQSAEEAKQKTEIIKGDIEIKKTNIEEESSSKTATLAMVSALLSKGVAIPAYLQPLVNATVENVMLPLVAQNEQQKSDLIKQTRDAQAQSMQPADEEQGEQMPPEQQQPIQQQQPQQAA